MPGKEFPPVWQKEHGEIRPGAPTCSCALPHIGLVRDGRKSMAGAVPHTEMTPHVSSPGQPHTRRATRPAFTAGPVFNTYHSLHRQAT